MTNPLCRVLHCGALAIACGILFVRSAEAVPVPVVNHSFEGDAFPLNGDASITAFDDVVTGWDETTDRADSWVYGGVFRTYGGAFAGTGTVGDTDGSNLPSPADGKQMLWMAEWWDGVTNSSFSYYYSQAVGTVAADSIYTLDVAVGFRSEFTVLPTVWGIALYSGEPSTGGTPLATLLNTNGATIPGIGAWVDNTLIWDSTGSGFDGQELRIVLVVEAMNASNNQIVYDNVRLDVVPVPEPHPIILSMIGSAACVLTIRGRMRSRV
jgi:hypothetical protein